MDRHKSDTFAQLEDALKAGNEEQTGKVNIQTGNNSTVFFAPNGKVEAFYNTEPNAASSLIPCPECGRRVSRYAECCPGCGLNVEKFFRLMTEARKREKFIKVFSIALIVSLCGFGMKLFGYDPFGWLGEVFVFGSLFTAIAAGKLIESGKI